MPYEIHFAPLQGYTDVIFRNAFDRYFGGIEVYYTPFIRIEKESFRKRDIRGIEPEENHVQQLVPQILAGTPEEFSRLADLLQSIGYTHIDINLGCSFPPIAGKKRGSGMLPYPELVEDMIGAVRKYPDLHFSVKMRLGWEKADECIAICHVLNAFPLEHITVHARIGKQQYKGDTDPDAFEAFYESCKHPVLYNGDLQTVEEIQQITTRFPKLKGIALGRGLLAHPFLAYEFKTGMIMPQGEKLLTYQKFHDTLFDTYVSILQGETQILMKMKSLWEYFLPETDHKLLKQIKKAHRLRQYTETTQNIFASHHGI